MMSFKNYKALIVDFDGTLVDTDFQVSPKLKEAIGKVMGKGYIFSIATGRLYQGIIKNTCENLRLVSPQIVAGGAEIIDPNTSSLLWHEYLPADSAGKIIKLFLENHYQFAVETEGSIFTPGGLPAEGYASDTVFKDLLGLDYHKIPAIVLDEANIKDLKEEAEKLSSLFADLHITRGGMKGAPVLDITSAKATKQLAVLELSKILNIPTKLMIGVGDGYNDYSLLSATGLKAVMESAPRQLKEIADIILPDVMEDGLADLISKLI